MEVMDARAKGRIGHEYTKQFLEAWGFLVYVCPHLQIQYRDDGIGGRAPMWQGAGWNDAFAVPTGDGKKKEGGFDIIALKSVTKEGEYGQMVVEDSWSLWQVKKTKANPITPAMKRSIIACCEYWKIPKAKAFVIWWPDRSGPKSTGPVIWRADRDEASQFNPIGGDHGKEL